MKKSETQLYPIIFESNFLTLFSYPLFMGLSWGIGYFFTKSFFEKLNEDTSKLLLLFIGIFISSWIGAKLFFLWFSSGHKIYQYLYADYFWLGGGFVFYGGLIFGFGFYLMWSKKFNKFDFKKSHLLLPGLILGHSVGRIGCFLTGCCYGKPTSVWWAVKMHEEFRHPVQLYEALVLFLIALSVIKFINQNIKSFKIISFYLITYAFARFILEFYRGDGIRGSFLGGLSSSQYVSIVIFIATAMYLYRKLKLEKLNED